MDVKLGYEACGSTRVQQYAHLQLMLIGGLLFLMSGNQALAGEQAAYQC